MAFLAGGVEPSVTWNLGDPETRHVGSDGRTTAPYIEYFSGSTTSNGNRPFTGVSSFDEMLFSSSISSDIRLNRYLLGYNNSASQRLEDRESTLNNLGVGDLVVSRDRIDSSSDHISMVVGWGPPEGGRGEMFYPSIEIAQASGVDTSGWVPYIIDHGGTNPKDYSRPWTEGVTTSVEPAINPEITISLINIEPASTGERE